MWQRAEILPTSQSTVVQPCLFWISFLQLQAKSDRLMSKSPLAVGEQEKLIRHLVNMLQTWNLLRVLLFSLQCIQSSLMSTVSQPNMIKLPTIRWCEHTVILDNSQRLVFLRKVLAILLLLARWWVLLPVLAHILRLIVSQLGLAPGQLDTACFALEFC